MSEPKDLVVVNEQLRKSNRRWKTVALAACSALVLMAILSLVAAEKARRQAEAAVRAAARSCDESPDGGGCGAAKVKPAGRLPPGVAKQSRGQVLPVAQASGQPGSASASRVVGRVADPVKCAMHAPLCSPFARPCSPLACWDRQRTHWTAILPAAMVRQSRDGGPA